MPMIEVKGVTRHFGGVPALKDVSFSMDSQEILGLIGPNGAGKTTLFNIISGFLKPGKGHVLLDGDRISGHKPNVLCRKGIARTFQVVRPFEEITVFENVVTGALCRSSNISDAKEKALKILADVDMSAKAHLKGKNLPIGDRKRLELARALATEPRVLLLDEVMAGLTPTEVNGIIRLIKDLQKNGLTIIVIEHNMSAIMSLSDRIVVLDHGEKIAEGMPHEVASNPDVVRAYLGENVEYA
jgi:branched-chain amino acid transport system ATP-binding protein